MTMMPLIALVTLISGVCSAGVTFQIDLPADEAGEHEHGEVLEELDGGANSAERSDDATSADDQRDAPRAGAGAPSRRRGLAAPSARRVAAARPASRRGGGAACAAAATSARPSCSDERAAHDLVVEVDVEALAPPPISLEQVARGSLP